MHYRNHVHKNKKNMHYFYFPLYFCGFTKNCPCDTCTLNALLCVSWYVWHLTTDQSQVISHSWYQITGGKHLLWHHLPAVESFTEFRQRLQKSNDKQIKLFWYTATFCLLHTNRDTHTHRIHEGHPAKRNPAMYTSCELNILFGFAMVQTLGHRYWCWHWYRTRYCYRTRQPPRTLTRNVCPHNSPRIHALRSNPTWARYNSPSLSVFLVTN